ncbi:MAG: phage major capsid protein [Clostridia bacterium]|jgi:HK97 family phage major capsid protein|nr:phage major capsid protein [Clostridia bacterium]
MFKSKAMNALVADLATKKTAAQALLTKEGVTADELTNAQKEITTVEAKISMQETIDAGKKFDENGEIVKDVKPVTPVIPAEPNSHAKMWKSPGEFLLAVKSASAPGGSVDPRLTIKASGASEAVPSDGGFLVDMDFSNTLLTKTYDASSVAAKAFRIPISEGKNGVKINGIDEKSRANGSRYGGVQMYWESEVDTVTGTKPKFRQIELSLKKLMGICYATDELLSDAMALQSIITKAFTDEFSFKVDDACINGTGSGQPLGILNAPCLVTVAKESEQAADTVAWANIVKMWSRMWGRSRQNATWFINQDIEPQLYSMALSVGTGGQPVYMPAGGASAQPYSTLFGRPVVPIEQCSALGDKGDIILADMSQYAMIDKGGLQSAQSIHVRFLYDENVFRFIYRTDGQPMWNSALTPYKGSNTLSPFVVLADR